MTGDEMVWTMDPREEALQLRASRIRQEDQWHSKGVCEVVEALLRDANTTRVPGAERALGRYSNIGT